MVLHSNQGAHSVPHCVPGRAHADPVSQFIVPFDQYQVTMIMVPAALLTWVGRGAFQLAAVPAPAPAAAAATHVAAPQPPWPTELPLESLRSPCESPRTSPTSVTEPVWSMLCEPRQNRYAAIMEDLFRGPALQQTLREMADLLQAAPSETLLISELGNLCRAQTRPCRLYVAVAKIVWLPGGAVCARVCLSPQSVGRGNSGSPGLGGPSCIAPDFASCICSGSFPMTSSCTRPAPGPP